MVRKATRMVEIVSGCFARHALKINWAKGKSAGMIKLRKAGAHQVIEGLRGENGNLYLRLPPECGEEQLELVTCFPHLGSRCSVLGATLAEARSRAGQAAEAAAKLSKAVFTAPELSKDAKMRCLSSLVMSRALFHTQLWPTEDRKCYAKVEAVYHRVLRQILQRKWDDEARVTDLAVRVEAKKPSIAATISARRLAYIGRVVRSEPGALYATLQCSADRAGQRQALPWTMTLRDDMVRMMDMMRDKVEELGHPDVCWEKWARVMASKQDWKMLVNLFIYRCVEEEAAREQRGEGATVKPPVVPADRKHACTECGKAFETGKALAQHRRVAHKATTVWKKFIGPTNSCPICKLVFSSRHRAIGHLSDGRRNQRCRQAILDGLAAELDSEVLLELDERARGERAKARQEGHSQPLAGRRPRRPDDHS